MQTVGMDADLYCRNAMFYPIKSVSIASCANAIAATKGERPMLRGVRISSYRRVAAA